MGTNAKPSWTSQPPRVGDIITCHYPGDPKPDLRPVLVLETEAADDGTFAVRVAYGTKSLDKNTRGKIDLIVESAGEVAACGLAVPTRFDLEEIARLPWDTPQCECWRGYSTPVIGRISTAQEIDCAYKLRSIQEKKRG